MEEVKTSAPSGRRLWQLYYLESRDGNLANIARAKALGMEAIVLTVDRPVLGLRDANLRNSLTLPGRDPSNPNAAAPASSPHTMGHISAALNWEDVEWLVGVAAPLPVVLKGVFTREDGQRAVRAGVGGVWVSNHGGRQLDGVASSCEALVEVLKGVREEEEEKGGVLESGGAGAGATPTTTRTRMPVWVDGGVRRGVDVVKLLCLGADFVWVGKPILWGLVGGGREGVEGVLTILGEEVKNALQLMGVTRVGDLNRDCVRVEF
jgi:(S)-2-hydroxy-acid oxidase